MIQVKTGSLIRYQGAVYRIVEARDLETLLVEAHDTGRLSEIPLAQVQSVSEAQESESAETAVSSLAELSESEKELAQHRYTLIAPLVDMTPRPRSAVIERAKETNSSVSTLYRLLRQFDEERHVASLARQPRSDAGQLRQPPEVLEVMQAVIQETYLKGQRHSIKYTYDELLLRCHKRGLKAPSRDTLSRQIQKVAPRERMRRRRGKNADEPLRFLMGEFPGAFAPWDVIQIDHTQLDLIIVTDDGREVAQRPYITVAIDGFSRAVLGFHVSRDAPSYFAAGACLSHAILPKDTYVAGHQKRLSDVLQDTLKDHAEVEQAMPNLRWPIWGRPTKVLVDNAREFRGKMFERSCHEYGIHVELRPVHKPWYGGYIERLMGAIATEIHNIPGTTFSNPRRRGEYDSSGKAIMTFDELELWLTIFFAGIYNQRPHRGIKGITPMEKYQSGLLEGTSDAPPKGLFPRPTPEEALKLRIDFLPSFEVTVQRTGITLDSVTYYHEVLEPYLARREPGKPSERFIVRRDPRNISQIYFYAEDVGRYFAIPYANPIWGQLSIWELRALKNQVRPEPGKHVKENDLLRELQAMRYVVQGAQKATREAKREQEKKRAHKKVEVYLEPEPPLKAPAIDDEEDDIIIIPAKVHH